MLYEFALDPCVLSNFYNVRYFLEKFGVQHGRLISRFPKKWKRMVFESCKTCGDIEQKRIEESLINADGKFISLNREYDSNIPWLENSEKQHTLKPFHAIISGSNPRDIAVVLIADELTETTTLWNVPREKVVPRRAADLAMNVQPLLQIATEVLFIDPHFDPTKYQYRNTLEYFVRVMSTNNGITRIEYHLKVDAKKPERVYFQNACSKHIPNILPAGIEVTFKRWRQLEGGETLHARYILTDKGGVRVEHGLDEGEDGEYTDVSLLDIPVYQQHWKNYHESPAFELVDAITIKGS